MKEMQVTFNLLIDEDKIIQAAERVAKEKLEIAIRNTVSKAIPGAVRDYFLKEPFSSEISEAVNSKEFLFEVANEAARRIISSKAFTDMIAKNIESSETVALGPEDFDDATDVRYLPLSTRAVNALHRAGIIKIEDLKSASVNDLIFERNVGTKTFEEIVRAAKMAGIEIRA